MTNLTPTVTYTFGLINVKEITFNSRETINLIILSTHWSIQWYMALKMEGNLH